LLEGAVFARRCAQTILNDQNCIEKEPGFEKDYDTMLHQENDKKYKHQLRAIMWKDAGIVRTKQGLLEAKNFIYDTKGKNIGRLLELRLNTAAAIVMAALRREESLGSHYIEN
jgi:L-aspartate oxidase